MYCGDEYLTEHEATALYGYIGYIANAVSELHGTGKRKPRNTPDAPAGTLDVPLGPVPEAGADKLAVYTFTPPAGSSNERDLAGLVSCTWRFNEPRVVPIPQVGDEEPTPVRISGFSLSLTARDEPRDLSGTSMQTGTVTRLQLTSGFFEDPYSNSDTDVVTMTHSAFSAWNERAMRMRRTWSIMLDLGNESYFNPGHFAIRALSLWALAHNLNDYDTYKAALSANTT